MRLSPSAAAMSHSALRRAFSMPLASRKAALRRTTSRAVSVSAMAWGAARALGARALHQRLDLEVLVGGLERVDDFVGVALHDLREAVDSEADAVVGEAALREIVGADALAAVAGADLLLAVLGVLRVLLVLLLLEEARVE